MDGVKGGVIEESQTKEGEGKKLGLFKFCWAIFLNVRFISFHLNLGLWLGKKNQYKLYIYIFTNGLHFICCDNDPFSFLLVQT